MSGLFAISLLLLPAVSFAQEGAAPEPAVEPPEAEAPAAPPQEELGLPDLPPITITIGGTLNAVKSTLTPPAIVVQDRYGVEKEIAVPAETKLTDGANPKQLSELQVGEKLTVEYTYDVATEKRTAQSILVGKEAL